MGVEVLLATSQDWSDGEPGAEALDDAFARRGIDARWAVWDDPAVDWAGAGLVAVRSTWDYTLRLEEFLDWAGRVDGETRLLNGAGTFAWNADKSYLHELGTTGLPVVPTLVVDGEEDLPSAIAEFGRAVVKPRVGAGGDGVTVFDGTDGGPPDLDESTLQAPPWVVQPLVESVRTTGEISVFVVDGVAISQVVKRPAEGEIRVHEHHGGRTTPVALDDDAADFALRSVRAVEELRDVALSYGRVDMMVLEGRLVVGEVELIEPGLYLDVLPGNAAPFVDLVARRLAADRRATAGSGR